MFKEDKIGQLDQGKAGSWREERENFFDKLGESTFLMDHRDFEETKSLLDHQENFKDINTLAMSVISGESARVIIDGETVQKLAASSEEFDKFVRILAAHEYFEIWYNKKQGFNLMDDTVIKVETGARPTAHFLAVRRELEEAKKLGVLDEYAKMFQGFLQKSIQEMTKGGKSVALMEQNLAFRAKYYEELKNKK